MGYTCVDSILKTGSAVCMVEFTDPFRVRPKLLSFNRAPNERRPGRNQFATADALISKTHVISKRDRTMLVVAAFPVGFERGVCGSPSDIPPAGGLPPDRVAHQKR